MSQHTRASYSSNDPIRFSMDEAAVGKKTIQRLLDTAIGSLTSQEWNAAGHTISWWTLQRTREGVDRAWNILDRLFEEEKYKLNRDWLNRIVDIWRMDAVTIQGSDGTGVALFAEQVLERMHQEAAANPFGLHDVAVL